MDIAKYVKRNVYIGHNRVLVGVYKPLIQYSNLLRLKLISYTTVEPAFIFNQLSNYIIITL